MKKFVNRSVFDEVMPKILLVRFFSGHVVYSFRQAEPLGLIYLDIAVNYTVCKGFKQ